ncbi:hypothetical protein SAMN05444266_101605 [Chitinophaga jiangningensis]|uniref:Uncharacterized protein n=1 Tax=Chitinophaga jiangningensis TaxID=1419482 RepID=A0A1M6WFP9_9BACT|nr:hypothetical protein [Chitinophaga jiangningensis]SHK92436.1 hypothetical protein SAMN05444266_101605 [Chitinophaga jiangningensis]
MKKLFSSIVITLLSISAIGQTAGNFSRVTVKDSIYLNGRWIKSWDDAVSAQDFIKADPLVPQNASFSVTGSGRVGKLSVISEAPSFSLGQFVISPSYDTAYRLSSGVINRGPYSQGFIQSDMNSNTRGMLALQPNGGSVFVGGNGTLPVGANSVLNVLGNMQATQIKSTQGTVFGESSTSNSRWTISGGTNNDGSADISAIKLSNASPSYIRFNSNIATHVLPPDESSQTINLTPEHHTILVGPMYYNQTYRLPAVADCRNCAFVFKRVNDNSKTATVTPAGTSNIDGKTSVPIVAGTAFTVQNDGSNWYTLTKSSDADPILAQDSKDQPATFRISGNGLVGDKVGIRTLSPTTTLSVNGTSKTFGFNVGGMITGEMSGDNLEKYLELMTTLDANANLLMYNVESSTPGRKTAMIQAMDGSGQFSDMNITVNDFRVSSPSGGMSLTNNGTTTTLSTGNANLSGSLYVAQGATILGQFTVGSIQSGSIVVGEGQVRWSSGAGSPEGVVPGNIGALYTRTDGGPGSTLYVKESGTGATGWVAK